MDNEENNHHKDETVLSELEQARKERDELLELSRRLKADFANLKKDQEKAMERFAEFAAADCAAKLLPLLDSLEYAMREIPAGMADHQWVAGIKNIKQQMESILKQMGVMEIPTVGMAFDPSLHEAVAQEDGEEDDKVTAQLQKGYRLRDRVIRAAKVKITSKKEHN